MEGELAEESSDDQGREHVIHYVGNGPYCYANAASMLLRTIRESVDPAQFEVLTGVGLGAFWIREPKLIIFSNLEFAPDNGTSKALDILGFGYKERSTETAGSPPFDELRTDLAASPAMLGPLDMGYLAYNPIHTRLGGADHFVLALEMDEREARVHDPEGFPHASISLAHLEKAWRAEHIPYRRGYYRYWTLPKRVRRPTDDDLYEDAIQLFKYAYRKSEERAAGGKWTIDRDAILECAGDIRRGKPTLAQRGHMVFFAFKLGARRALDYAAFMEPRDTELAALKRTQAELFGRCHTLATSRKWSPMADSLAKLADVEEKIRSAVLAR